MSLSAMNWLSSFPFNQTKQILKKNSMVKMNILNHLLQETLCTTWLLILIRLILMSWPTGRPMQCPIQFYLQWLRCIFQFQPLEHLPSVSPWQDTNCFGASTPQIMFWRCWWSLMFEGWVSDFNPLIFTRIQFQLNFIYFGSLIKNKKKKQTNTFFWLPSKSNMFLLGDRNTGFMFQKKISILVPCLAVIPNQRISNACLPGLFQFMKVRNPGILESTLNQYYSHLTMNQTWWNPSSPTSKENLDQIVWKVIICDLLHFFPCSG